MQVASVKSWRDVSSVFFDTVTSDY